MKLQIRKGTFETNSSSMHSLVVKNDNIVLTAEEIKENINHYVYKNRVDGCGDWYFGRFPFRILSSFFDKWRYYYANCAHNDSMEKEALQVLKDYADNQNLYLCKESKSAGVDELYLDEWLKKENITIHEFLTNSKYIVISDGDEYCIWKDIKEIGLIRKDVKEV